jgi:hypothetical protein
MKQRGYLIGILTLMATFLSVSPVSGSPSFPSSQRVASSLIRTFQGTTCAYLPNTDPMIGLKHRWVSGTRSTKGRFISDKAVTDFYKGRGKSFKGKYKAALSRQRLGDSACKRLTGLKFRTRGFVGFAVADMSLKKSKRSVSKASTAKVAIAGLYGVTPTGTTASVISAITSIDTSDVALTRINRVYQAPDGSIVIYYLTHPNDCFIGRIRVGEVFETCILLRSDLPQGATISDGLSQLGDETEVVQFDEVGGVYALLVVPATFLGCQNESSEYASTILRIEGDGTQTIMRHPRCRSGILSWTTLDSGGVFMAQHCFTLVDSSCHPGILSIWDGTNYEVLMDGVLNSPNGIQSMPDGKIVVLVHSYGPSRPLMAEWSQGGVLVYEASTKSFTNWLHLRANSPRFAVEDIFAACECRPGTVYVSGGTSNGQAVFGVMSGAVVSRVPGFEFPVVRSFPIAARIYPEPKMLTMSAEVMSRMNSTTVGIATEKSYIIAGPSYATCQLSQRLHNWIPCESEQMGLIDIADNSYTILTRASDGIGVLTFSKQTDGNLVFVQAIRKSDGKYLLGIIDEQAKIVRWSEVSNLSYRYLVAVKPR